MSAHVYPEVKATKSEKRLQRNSQRIVEFSEVSLMLKFDSRSRPNNREAITQSEKWL